MPDKTLILLRTATAWSVAALGCAWVLPAAGEISQPEQPSGLMRWFDPSVAPFIPVPEIDVDPLSGTTLGLIPTWLITDDHSEIRKIIAPDVLYNPYFGVGARGRIYAFPSDDSQWSMVGGLKQRVESEFDYEYQTGRLRSRSTSLNASVVYDRSGTPRFYGVGNQSPRANETNYTLQQEYVQTVVGWNLRHEVQLSYLLRIRAVDVQPGTLANILTIGRRFSDVTGIGSGQETLHRVSIAYDSRDDATVPTHGTELVLYGGIAAKHGLVNDSQYGVAGVDARRLWTPVQGNTLVMHAALRYLTGAHAPFWSLSSLGGDQSVIGEAQPLRGFGAGRYYDRNSLSASAEYRHRVVSVDAMTTHINVEVTPFVDLGEVFAHSRALSWRGLHHVAGVGFRGIASPFVVGYLDFGLGSEGIAIFTGINYPF